MKLIVDRIEEGYVICETEEEKFIQINKNEINFKVEEGQVLNKEENKIYLDEEETQKRKNYIKELLKDMWQE
jgi:hypothetical protein